MAERESSKDGANSHLPSLRLSPASIEDRESMLAGNKAQLLKLAHHFKDAGSFLDFALSDDMALTQAPVIWESISEDPNNSGLINPELLVHKVAALCFVEPYVIKLLRFRSAVLKEADEIRGLIREVEVQLEKEEAGMEEDVPVHPPAGYEPWRLNGPQLFYHAEKFGKVDWEANSRTVQEIAKKMGICPDQLYANDLYWRPDKAWKRQVNAVRAFNEFNKMFLEVKLDAVQAFANKLAEGADRLLVAYLRGPSYLGASPMDYSNQQFINKNICIDEEDSVHAVMDDERLFYDGDGDDSHPPLENVEIPYIEVYQKHPVAGTPDEVKVVPKSAP